jgi:hypothetical protein
MSVILAIWIVGAICNAANFGWNLDIKNPVEGHKMVVCCVGWPFILIASLTYAARGKR